MSASLDIVVLGLSITSSWGNGHATNYRALTKAAVRRGHRVLFLERDAPWYAAQRDLPVLPWGELGLYGGLDELRECWSERVRRADLVLLGSFVPDGREIARWLLAEALGTTAFYDIDTPRTLEQLERDACPYLARPQVAELDLYLSFSGGPVLDELRERHGARRPKAFYCCVDPEVHRPLPERVDLALGYLGTYSADRQPALERLLLATARARPAERFAVAGSCYPSDTSWPENVERIEHLPPGEHARFYARQRLTVNVTRADMVRAGWSPSVRLFEAAACGVPALSDPWPGLEQLFSVGEEILVARTSAEALALLDALDPDARERLGERARARVLAEHTADHRVRELERHLEEVRGHARGHASLPTTRGVRAR